MNDADAVDDPLIRRLRDAAEYAVSQANMDPIVGGVSFSDPEDSEEEYADQDGTGPPAHPYTHLREISSLASWTVSTHKPGSGVRALLHPSPQQYWQSDGPQPHILNIHFFKQVRICHIRFYVDHELDESYTPTRLQIWAGTGHHDLQLVTEIAGLENPKGWLVVPLDNAGGASEFGEGDDEDLDAEVGMLGLPSGDVTRALAKRRRRAMVGRGATLRCFLVQVRIMENHQNGKDTHLRGMQLFAKDHEAAGKQRRAKRAKPDRQQLADGANGAEAMKSSDKVLVGIKEADFMKEPVIR